jgi:uroporphyrinogen decarboxylase
MNAKENYLEAIRFGEPEHVPLDDEPIWFSFQFEGNFRMADWTDAWGVRWEMGLADTVPFPKQNPLGDLDRLADYEFPDPDELPLAEEAREGLRRADRSEKLVCGQLTYLLFERAWALTGMDEFLMALVARPDDAHALLHGIAEFDRRVFERYLELGVDAVGFSEDLGTQKGLMMSPEMFREFFLPEYRHMFGPLGSSSCRSIATCSGRCWQRG